jgi:hypothetical protein
VHASRTERLRERFGRRRLAFAGEGEAVLDAISVDHLARDHLEMALLLAVPAAHVPAVKPNHNRDNRGGWRHRSQLRRLDAVSLHNGLAHSQRPVSDRTRVPSSTYRQRLDSSTATLPNGANAAYRAVT